MGEALFALIAIGIILRVAYKAQYPEPEPKLVTIDDGVCRCGSHTHPGFICNRCGGEA